MAPRVRIPRAICLAIAALCTVVAGCRARPAFDGRRYQGNNVAFRAGPVPQAWSQLATDYGLLAFRDRDANASILVNGRCRQDGDDVPLGALMHHLFLQFTERDVREEHVVPFDGREALVTVMDAKLDGVRRTFEALVLKKNSCVYDFVLVVDPSAFPRARIDFERFVAGFHAEDT